MTLLFDIGNTRVKAALYSGDTFIREEKWIDNDIHHLLQLIGDSKISHCAFSNVGRERPELCSFLHTITEDILFVDGTTRSPLNNPFPGLGADRYAAAVGAWTLCPKHPLLVIDAGTCVTYDFISAEGKITGGNISPGLMLRLKSMHEHTALLPLISAEGPTPLVGYNLDTALRSGAYLGLHFEIEGFIRHFTQENTNLQVFFTGGDMFEFDDDLAHRIHTETQLIDIGLLTLLNYQSDKL